MHPPKEKNAKKIYMYWDDAENEENLSIYYKKLRHNKNGAKIIVHVFLNTHRYNGKIEWQKSRSPSKMEKKVVFLDSVDIKMVSLVQLEIME